MKIKRLLKWYYIAPIVVVAIPLFLALMGEIVMRLWNGLLPPLFGWPQITRWQALGLLVLCRILFGGFGSGGGRHPKDMTPEERERFRRRIRERFRESGESHEAANDEAHPVRLDP